MRDAGAAVVGLDLSTAMVRTARLHDPAGPYVAGSMLALPITDAAWAGAAAAYSIIHLSAAGRRLAMTELSRVVRAGGWALVTFHTDSPDFPMGGTNHLSEWFGHKVDVDVHFLDPAVVTGDLELAGFEVMATTVRKPWPSGEYPSRRCYLLARNGRGPGA